MPICPFCRKSVEVGSVWCACGTNLGRYPTLPVSDQNIRKWLATYAPELIQTSVETENSLVDRARRRLIDEQEDEIAERTRAQAEIDSAKQLIANFLNDCHREGLGPTIDIGQLRRDRWRQWKRIPAEYRQNPPLKNFKVTPGYLLEISIANYKDEFCLALDGTLYKHQLNAPDPFSLEELLYIVPAAMLADALTLSVIWLLKSKQTPTYQEEPGYEPAPAAPKRRFGLPFRQKSADDDSSQPVSEDEAAEPAAARENPGPEAAPGQEPAAMRVEDTKIAANPKLTVNN